MVKVHGSFLFLGTGASAGVPVVGCACSVCQSINPHNQRLRPSGLLRLGDISLLIDIGPDFRQQALRYKINHLDGLLLTHTHYDHIAGIDELRALNFRQKKPFPCLLSQESLLDLKQRYSYLFKERKVGEARAAELDCHLLPYQTGLIHFLRLPICYTTYFQGAISVNGFRIGNFAYISDIRKYDDDIFSFLSGVDQLVLGALRKTSSHAHFSFQEAVDFANKAGVKQTWLTHISHATDHADVCQSLPPSVQPAFDGLELEISYA